mmetsp:Transcript_1274/g.2016  ORF Transcript_1274/g.2016 Transcript_1274/m.2016 type:complete len:173 (+) Transcript_1274:242-760(+)|eukprot:CAMPEP_0203745594 /NCGR_PEP_ID=MMETSP0098-20131031/1277_1 /ASSEMBLY_ACC=CAM_ASM_000208 /TAXON_ID=96639 /ORGANISM=" , Strain NY0313808BC1" /LENGTH=172 /DNA_ID=CAMNT_0050633407 /DNA_START=2294 /DNA_END=2812 /DNA_ORIENTATION=-
MSQQLEPKGSVDGAGCSSEPVSYSTGPKLVPDSVISAQDWNMYISQLNQASAEHMDRQCGCCPYALGAMAGLGWMNAMRAAIQKMNTESEPKGYTWSIYRQSTRSGNNDSRPFIEIKWKQEAALGSASPATQTMPETKSPKERLKDLQEMLNDNMISQEDYDKKKQQILNSM